ncbi:hypothetical protein IGI04_023046 [Brassica rapa subsp. trilocularis]|uniref:Uncharacterized protein n=1 Tax=Brassica rapa subsp. trilocularis TaxID=1813537 RepID=A0ABQ7M2R8_BRACM|nr:hypothetical protein IGI04_023046 [Brassica rapa subsp. trilocularis]
MSHEIFRKSSEVLCPKWYKFWICNLLLGKSSNVFYARRLPTKFSGSLLKSSGQSGTQRNDVKCSSSLSMLRNDIYLYV